MGCIYCGYDTDKRKNGRLKIGMTEKKYPTSRLTACGLNGLWYFHIPGATKAELLMIESAARLAGERTGLRQYGNDHFYYVMNYPRQPQKHQEAWNISMPIYRAVEQACNLYNLRWESYRL